MAETIKDKQRLRYAKKKAINILKEADYNAFSINDDVFTIQAEREKEIRKIRIVLNKIDDEDKNLVKNFNSSQLFIKEIWVVKKNIFGKLRFEKVPIS